MNICACKCVYYRVSTSKETERGGEGLEGAKFSFETTKKWLDCLKTNISLKDFFIQSNKNIF